MGGFESIDEGVAGASAQRAFERGVEQHRRRLEDRWGHGVVGRFAKKLSKPPKESAAWLQGAEGQRKVAGRLADDLGDTAIFLHDRDVTGADEPLDHLVIASSGVWMVDSKDYAGELQASSGALLVNGVDRSSFVNEMAARRAAIEEIVDGAGIDTSVVRQAICFVSSEWQFFPTHCEMQGVRIVWPKKLSELVGEPGPLTASEMFTLAERLSHGFPVTV